MTTNCPWCGKPEGTENIAKNLPAGDPGSAYCWNAWMGDDCPNKPTFSELLARAQTTECRVAELETDRLVLWWFLAERDDQPMPPGANPCKQAIEAIQALRAERDRLAEIVERLPKTADGVPVTPEQEVWVPAGVVSSDARSYRVVPVDSSLVGVVEEFSIVFVSDNCYSTRAAAEAARAKGGA